MEQYKLVLKKAYEEIEQYELSQIPEDNEINWTPSWQFEQKMNKLIKTQKRKREKSNITGKKLTIILIAVITTLICAIGVGASREEYITFSKSVTEEETSLDVSKDLKYKGNIPEKIETIYTIPYLDDKLPVSSYYNDGFQVVTEWGEVNDKSEPYILLQTICDSSFTFNTEGTKMIQTKINGYNVYTYNQTNYSCYIWSENGYIFTLNTPRKTNYRFAKKVIGKLQIKK